LGDPWSVPLSLQRCLRSSLLWTAFLSVTPVLLYADWPQWRGPLRDGVSTETGLLKQWPADGPPRVWIFEQCGLGYSGPAIVGKRLFTMGARGDKELLISLDVDSGDELWATPIGETLGNNWGDGPRGTPTVDGELVYVISAKGNIACVDAASGEVRWTKTMEEFGGSVPTWGYSESPLIFEESLICTPGGEQGSIIALNKHNGDLVWQAADLKSGAHYASCVLAERPEGIECVQLLPDQVVGVDAKSGDVWWSIPWPKPVAAIPTPVVADQYVYATSGYGVGCKLIEVGPNHAATEIYHEKIMKNKHGGVVLLDGRIYGHSDGVGWVCQDLVSGKQVWRERDPLEMGAVTSAEGKLYCVGQDSGDVVLADASPEGWQEISRFTLSPQSDQRKPEGRIWTHPVICDGKLYLRDQNLLYCFDVSDRADGVSAAEK
jgi:outer membrane protein assembly factor BamB